MSEGLGSVQNHLAKLETILDLQKDQAFVYKSVQMFFYMLSKISK